MATKIVNNKFITKQVLRNGKFLIAVKNFPLEILRFHLSLRDVHVYSYKVGVIGMQPPTEVLHYLAPAFPQCPPKETIRVQLSFRC